ncbi:tetratricopeptide repeat protein [Xanthomonadaceae bacterium JHOS43]|nr:tetratricopeptide repeat protein [Xanthomonadaceae bacterium JHOS43]MCX7564413.1 tetratricopeptide repeat protein [Xanthomonadaceae bacterium XH05]
MNTARPLLAEWDALGATSDEDIDLVSAAMLVARDEYPAMDPDHYESMFAAHADAVGNRLPARSDAQQRLAALSRYLFEELGFSGNHDEFYDPRNSYLNDVLDRRLGIPLSLALVQMELARRLDVPLEGVSFPGHFLVRLQVEDGLLVLDPYHRGRSIDADELRQRASPHLGETDIDDQQLLMMLAPASHRAIVMRMLRNLKNLYQERDDVERSLRCADRLVRLAPHHAESMRDRGVLYHQIGHLSAARDDLTRYLALAPHADDHDTIRTLMIGGSRTAARTH